VEGKRKVVAGHKRVDTKKAGEPLTSWKGVWPEGKFESRAKGTNPQSGKKRNRRKCGRITGKRLEKEKTLEREHCGGGDNRETVGCGPQREPFGDNYRGQREKKRF